MKNNYKYGFTIIEVVLVLAIAGLIFAMTFIALPNLWASQRDAQRRNDMTTFMSTLKSYQSNNSRGALPGARKSGAGNGSDNEEIENGKVVAICPGLQRDCDGYSIYGIVEDRERDEKAKVFANMSWAGFYRDYFGPFEDPLGVPYRWHISKCTTDSASVPEGEPTNMCTEDGLDRLGEQEFANNPNQYVMHIVVGAVCDGNVAVKSNNDRNVAVEYLMERAGTYCYTSR